MASNSVGLDVIMKPIKISVIDPRVFAIFYMENSDNAIHICYHQKYGYGFSCGRHYLTNENIKITSRNFIASMASRMKRNNYKLDAYRISISSDLSVITKKSIVYLLNQFVMSFNKLDYTVDKSLIDSLEADVIVVFNYLYEKDKDFDKDKNDKVIDDVDKDIIDKLIQEDNVDSDHDDYADYADDKDKDKHDIECDPCEMCDACLLNKLKLLQEELQTRKYSNIDITDKTDKYKTDKDKIDKTKKKKKARHKKVKDRDQQDGPGYNNDESDYNIIPGETEYKVCEGH